MAEKISDFRTRLDKVKKVKSKILSEIDELVSDYKGELKQCLSSNSEGYEVSLKSIFVLLNLKEYINQEGTFLSCEYKNPDIDTIYYTVADRYLNVWLNKEYHFARLFVLKTEEVGYNVFSFLNEWYFGHEFTDAIDEIIYEKKSNDI